MYVKIIKCIEKEYSNDNKKFLKRFYTNFFKP